MIIIACPGQGSQTPGFLQEWIEAEELRSTLEHLSASAGVDLIEHGTVSDADTIRDTMIAQPLIVGASLLAWQELSQRVDHAKLGIAGHSVGEFAAAAIAGVVDNATTMRLVATRGNAMAEASTRAVTSMSAVLGGDEDEVLAAIERFGLTPANRNGAGQIVAAGDAESLTTFAAEPPKGARVMPLQVAGAFHTDYMSSAIPVLKQEASDVTPQDPTLPLWSNAHGSVVKKGQEYLDLLVSQISNPVRWDLCMESFLASGITGLIELAPAGALTGIARRALKGVPTVAIKKPADIDAAVQLIEEQA